jgi:hypothetical protein
MLAGRWQGANPNAGIVFDTDNVMIDGQHRLTGVILANNQNAAFKGVEMYVYRDVPASVRHVMDIGRIRTLGDILAMEGNQNASIAGAASELVLNYLEGSPRITARRTKPEKFDFAIAHPALFSHASLAHSVGKQARQSSLCAVTFLGTRSGDLDEIAARFVSGIANGAELSINDPRLTLRDEMSRARGAKGGSPSLAWTFAATSMAWNKFVTGEEMPTMRGVTRDRETNEWPIFPIHGAPEIGAGIENINAAALKPRVRQMAERTLSSLAHEEEAVA